VILRPGAALARASKVAWYCWARLAVAKLPVSALHVDLDRAPEQLDQVLAAVKPTQLKLRGGQSRSRG
jgi:hypothetical protein